MQLVIEQLHRALRDPGCSKQVKNYPFLMGQGVWLDSRKAGLGRRGGRGAQARHAVRGLHRPGRDPEGPAWAPITGESEETPRTWAWRSSATCASVWTRRAQERKLNYTLLATPAEGLSGRFVQHGPGEVRRHPRGDRPGILHQQLPCAGVLPHLRLRQDQRGGALSRADQRRAHQLCGDGRRSPAEPGRL